MRVIAVPQAFVQVAANQTEDADISGYSVPTVAAGYLRMSNTMLCNL